jgi:hypothetical protein
MRTLCDNNPDPRRRRCLRCGRQLGQARYCRLSFRRLTALLKRLDRVPRSYSLQPSGSAVTEHRVIFFF